MGRPGKVFTKEFLHAEYMIAGKNVAQIARENHCLSKRVSQQLRDCGIETKRGGARSKKIKMTLTKEFLEEHYVRQEKSILQIEEETSIHSETISRHLKKCGIATRRAPGRQRKEMIGRKFGRLKAVSFSHINEEKRAFWKCVCSCGNHTIVCGKELRRHDSRGGTRSCGCTKRELKYRILPGTLWCKITAGARNRGLSFSITPEYIETLFDQQGGKCKLSGRPILLLVGKECTASLDRIDSKIGYEPDNVQWVHKIVNLMKQDFREDEFIEFCIDIANHQSLSNPRDRGDGLPR